MGGGRNPGAVLPLIAAQAGAGSVHGAKATGSSLRLMMAASLCSLRVRLQVAALVAGRKLNLKPQS